MFGTRGSDPGHGHGHPGASGIRERGEAVPGHEQGRDRDDEPVDQSGQDDCDMLGAMGQRLDGRAARRERTGDDEGEGVERQGSAPRRGGRRPRR